MQGPTLPAALTTDAHTFLQPTSALHSSLLQLAKQYLDPLAADITDVQLARLKEQRKGKKRRRGERHDEEDGEDLLRMKRVHVEGFEVEQVWEQARRVLDAARTEVERDVPEDEEEDVDGADVHGFDEEAYEMNDDEDDGSLGEEGIDWEYDGDDVDQDEYEDTADLAPLSKRSNGDIDMDEDSQDIGEDSEMENDSDSKQKRNDTFTKYRHGLNDGFFSIDDFNRQTQFLERQDERGDPDDGAASDEEDIDWTMNPFAANTRTSNTSSRKNSYRPRDDGSDEDDDEEAGPTFGNMDLNAPEGASEDELDDEDADLDIGTAGFSNANDVFYKDFFAPPPRDPTKKKTKEEKRADKAARGNPNLDSVQNPRALAKEPGYDSDDEDMQRTISGVHRDLFDESPPPPDSPTTANATSNLSTHERAQLALRAEIRRLEAENVAARPWTLTGETVAPARPLNSLLSADLDFERAGKPLPVPTDDANTSIESLIKRRILAREFDELPRRRPDALAAPPRRGARPTSPVSSAPPSRSLAADYEAEHQRATDPAYVDVKDAALAAQHAQVAAHWAAVAAQLDALCSWRFRPAPAQAGVEVRVDAPVVRMEDARPTAGGEAGGASALAPQELYRAGEDGKGVGEVVTRGGTAVAREEEGRDARRRRKRREKERAKKAAGNKPRAADGAGESGKKDVVGELKKGGVGIIDKKGAVRDVSGQERQKGEEGRAGGGSFML